MTASEVEPTRDDLIEALRYVNDGAKRAPCVIGTVAYPSRWDKQHDALNDLLDQLVGL